MGRIMLLSALVVCAAIAGTLLVFSSTETRAQHPPARAQERDGDSTIRSRKVLLETCTYPPFCSKPAPTPPTPNLRTRARGQRAVLRRPVLEILTPYPVNPTAFGSANAFGRFLCVGELLSLAISSNSPHTAARVFADAVVIRLRRGPLSLGFWPSRSRPSGTSLEIAAGPSNSCQLSGAVHDSLFRHRYVNWPFAVSRNTFFSRQITAIANERSQVMRSWEGFLGTSTALFGSPSFFCPW